MRVCWQEGYARENGRVVGYARDYEVLDAATGKPISDRFSVVWADDAAGEFGVLARDNRGGVLIWDSDAEAVKAVVKRKIRIVPTGYREPVAENNAKADPRAVADELRRKVQDCVTSKPWGVGTVGTVTIGGLRIPVSSFTME